MMKDYDLSKLHDCKKCHGKMVCISSDNVGVTRCGYCNQVVNYKPFYDHIKNEIKKEGLL